MMAKKVVYSEPVDFIPKSVRKEFGLGEYSKANNSGNKSNNNNKSTKKSK